MMKLRRKQYWLAALLLLMTSLAISCGEMNKANQMVEAGNAAATEGERFAEEALSKIDGLKSNLNDFPANREQLRASAQEIAAGLDQSVAKLREAAADFADASKTKIDATLKEYLSLKSQEFSKQAEHIEAWKDVPNAITDASIKDHPALDARFAQITTHLEQLHKEWTDLEAQAEKIKTENKSKFKS